MKESNDFQTITPSELKGWDRIKRLNFFNSVSGFKSPHLIGTRSAEGVENLAVFNSIFHVGSNPPYLGFVLRPTTVARHTYENIKNTGFYTINHVHRGFYKEAHYTSAKFTEGDSEFEQSGLTPLEQESFRAPFVGESLIRIGLKFEEEHLFKCNGTRAIIGAVQMMTIAKNLLTEEGPLRLEQSQNVVVKGLDEYFVTEKLARLSFARPGEDMKEI